MRLIGRLIAATLAVAAVVVGIMSASGRGHFGVAVLLLVAASTCNSIARHFDLRRRKTVSWESPDAHASGLPDKRERRNIPALILL